MMRVGLLNADGKFEIQERPIPQPGADEVLLRVAVCGVCMSEVSMWHLGENAKAYPFIENVLDWELAQSEAAPQQYPILMGHEPGGEIVAVGENVTHLKPGQRVTALGYSSFAEYAVVDAAYVQPLQDDTPFHLALGEPIACAYNAARRADVQEGESVVLVGCGFMGLMHLQMLKLANPSVIVAVDIRDDALQAAAQVGADVTINGQRENVIEAVREAIGPKGADVVVEAVGKQAGLDLATRLVGWNGRIVVIGYHQGEPRSIDMGTWNVKAINVINAHERYQEVYFRGMVGGIDLLESGQLDMATLVTHRYPLAQLGDAFHQALEKPPEFIKAVVDIA